MFHRVRNHWRQFRPYERQRRKYKKIYPKRDIRQDKQYFIPREEPVFTCATNDIFDCAEQEVVALLSKHNKVKTLDHEVEHLRKKFFHTKQVQDGLAALLIQVPRAVLAQLQMDQHPHGYHDKHARLFELIDFNDTLTEVVIAMHDDDRRRFDSRVKEAADRVCRRVGAPCFSNEQWEAIVRGLSREIAIYVAARDSGFDTAMGSRTQDALGVDVQIRDPESGRYINIDSKTPSAFRHRLEVLVDEGRLTTQELLAADERSYAVVHNGHGGRTVTLILLCILPDLFGEVKDFEFVDPTPMRDMLNRLIRDHGLTDGMFGVS